jgi:SAM-dependent methyltransferase
MKTRTDLLNHIAEKYNLQNYLEIGLQVAALNFDKIKCPYKISVDPNPNAKADFVCTSDEYFEDFPKTKFDLIFIDGLHTAEQVKKDFENALKILSPNGFIVLHDTNPETYERTIVPRPNPSGPWNGDVYKTAC